MRKCRLDLAPEAPWRCPDDCPRFELRRMDTGWQYGSLGTAAARPAPEPEGTDVAALLDEAEGIVNAAAPDIISEIAAEQPKKKGRLGGRKKKKKK